MGIPHRALISLEMADLYERTDDELDLKSFMEAHEISPWQSECDHIQQVFRAADIKVLLVEKSRQDEIWRVCVIRQEPNFFRSDAQTLDRIWILLRDAGIPTFRNCMTGKVASFRLEFTFGWSGGVCGRGVSYGFAKRGRLVEFREEYTSETLKIT